MANKFVIPLVGAGVGCYMLSEKYLEKQAERERENRAQERRDRIEEMNRRHEEKLRKKGSRSFKAQMNNFTADVLIEKEFQAKVFSYLEEMLCDLTLKVGKEAAPLHNWNRHMLNLPLMSNEYDKEDIMLAAAFALGDSDVVDRVISSFSKQKLGIGLKTFTKRSIMNIISVLESSHDPDIDFSSLGMFTSFGVYHSDLRGEKPALLILQSQNCPSYSDNLRVYGEKFGMHVSHESWLHMVSKKEPSKTSRARFVLNKKFHREGGRLILSNFRCSFDTPYKFRDSGNMRYFSPNFEDIRLLTNTGAHNRCKPDLDEIAKVFASKLVAGMAREAARRLSQLLKRRGHGEEGISLEHISINSGARSTLLQDIARADMGMIRSHEKQITSTLTDVLIKRVPIPDKKDLVEGESPKEKLATEVSCFVDAYIQLVNLSYCGIPLLSGRPPSAFVPKFSVFGEVTQHKDCFWSDDPIMTCSVSRLLIKEERERLARSRELAAPGESFVALFIFAMSIVLFWISVAALRPFFGYDCLLYAVGLALALSALYQSFYILGKMCSIPADIQNPKLMQHCWKIASYCTEFIHRKIAVKLGKSTPFDQQMRKLRESCGSVFRVWRMRIAKIDFEVALKRKRITNKEAVLLLTEMSEMCYETEEEEVIEGVFQAELNEVEQFLKLRVEEGTSCTEVALSPDDAVKNYLDMATDETSKEISSLAQLCNMSATVEECVLFGEGERVLVQTSDEAEDPHLEQVTGSVVFSTATLVYVHFDGVPAETPTPVPKHLCSILVENMPLLENAQLKDTCTEDVTSLSSESDESVIKEMSEEEHEVQTNVPQA